MFLVSKPVRYSEHRPLLYRTPDDFMRHAYQMSARESVMAFMDNIIFTKSTNWTYEAEYRLAIPELIKEDMPFM